MTGLIGPNAVLQMLPVLERLGGPERVDQMLARAGIFHLPDGTAMIPERDAARLHQLLRAEEPLLAPALSAEAGKRTARYIMAHRIPKPVQLLLKVLPAPLAARLLSTAIDRHAWTFAGSGRFHVQTPWIFEIENNPLIRGEHGTGCLCSWHAGVFTELYRRLVSPHSRCTETHCGAAGGDPVCRFEIRRS